MSDEFYIGWEAKAAPGIGKTVRRFVALMVVVMLGLALAFAAMQRTIGVGAFEYGDLKKFTGTLKVQPYPHLLVRRPGTAGAQTAFSVYYLVAPFKFGLDRDKLSPLDGHYVSLMGTLIYRGNQTMVEAVPDTIKIDEQEMPLPPGTETVALGRQTLEGEIVDSKCFLGVMNPGQLAPHRGCAIRCISGGIPPVLLVRQKDGQAVYLLLVSADGKPVNKEVLAMVAEPVQITGEVRRQDGLLILRADPATYLRVGK
jgi:hypothetical protein